MRSKIDHPGSLLAPSEPVLVLAVLNPRFQWFRNRSKIAAPKHTVPHDLAKIHIPTIFIPQCDIAVHISFDIVAFTCSKTAPKFVQKRVPMYQCRAKVSQK